MATKVDYESPSFELFFDDGTRLVTVEMRDPYSTANTTAHGFENSSAQEYAQAWVDFNLNDDNPYVNSIVSEVFEKEIGENTWYGFTANESLTYQNDGGGKVLNEEITILVLKKGTLFFTVEYESSFASEVEEFLTTFKFN